MLSRFYFWEVGCPPSQGRYPLTAYLNLKQRTQTIIPICTNFKSIQHTQNIIPSSTNFKSIPSSHIKIHGRKYSSLSQFILLLLLLLCAYWEWLMSWGIQVVELKVGMHCERCIKAIKKAIKKIEGAHFIMLIILLTCVLMIVEYSLKCSSVCHTYTIYVLSLISVYIMLHCLLV